MPLLFSSFCCPSSHPSAWRVSSSICFVVFSRAFLSLSRIFFSQFSYGVFLFFIFLLILFFFLFHHQLILLMTFTSVLSPIVYYNPILFSLNDENAWTFILLISIAGFFSWFQYRPASHIKCKNTKSQTRNCLLYFLMNSFLFCFFHF